MKTITANKDRVILLGRLGENEYTRVEFDVAAWLEEMPTATISLYNQRSGDTTAYPIAQTGLDLDGTKLYWTITNTELSAEGSGRCELVATVGDVIAKSTIYQTRVLNALDGAGDPPDPWDSWQEEFVAIEAAAQQYAADAEAAVAHYPYIGEDGYWYVWDGTGSTFVSTGVKAQGDKGDQGDSYVLTNQDKQDIADLVVTELGLTPAEGEGF